MKKYWLLQVLHVFRSVLCADNDPSTHSDEDQTPKTIIQGFGHSQMYATSVTAVERGHHWSMLMDMNIDQRLGWQRFRVQYCEIGRYDKKLSHSFIHSYEQRLETIWVILSVLWDTVKSFKSIWFRWGLEQRVQDIPPHSLPKTSLNKM